MSPKMQTLVNEINAGTKVVIESAGNFLTYMVEADGTTWGGRNANPTIKSLISQGILVKGEGNSWILAA